MGRTYRWLAMGALLAVGCGRTPGGAGGASATGGASGASRGPTTTVTSTFGPTTYDPTTWGPTTYDPTTWGPTTYDPTDSWSTTFMPTTTSGGCDISCPPPTCENGVLDGDETDVDCGGSCPLCDEGKSCKVDGDCALGGCDQGVCACVEWSFQVGDGFPDGLEAVTRLPGGEVVAVGYAGDTFDGTERSLMLAWMTPAEGSSTWAIYPAQETMEPPLLVGHGVAPAGPSTVYIAGALRGAFSNEVTVGGQDALFGVMALSGFEFVFTHVQVVGTALTERAADVVVAPNGDGLVVGDFHDDLGDQMDATRSAAFVLRVAPDGAVKWMRLLNTMQPEFGAGVAVTPGGEIVVVGQTQGVLGSDPPAGGQDVFVARFPPDGPPIWIRQFGTAGWDEAAAVAVDDLGDIYLLANSSGSFLGAANKGGRDVFLAKLDGQGNPVWVTALGTTSNDYGADLAVHPDGGVVLVGRVVKSLDGLPAFGGWDVLVARFDEDGNELWKRQVGSSGDDGGRGVVVHPTGSVTVAVRTNGELPGPKWGEDDGSLVHLCP